MARRGGHVFGNVIVGLAVVFGWPTCGISDDLGPRAPRSYMGYRCPFDVQGVTAVGLGERLRGPMGHPLEASVCAVQALYEKDASVRAVGLSALFPDGDPVVEGLRSAPSSSSGSRGQSVSSDDLVLDIVHRATPQLEAPDASARTKAAWLLGLLGHPAAVPGLSQRVSDPDVGVRSAVVMALREIHDPRALEPLIEAARGPDEHIGYAAVAGVAAIGGPRAREALLEIMGSWRLDANVRLSAAIALRVSGDPVAVAAAERYLASLRPQWQRAFYFAALLYYLAFLASRPGSSRWWRGGFYAAAVGSILFLINPVWVIVGQEKAVFWGLAVWYPLGLGVGVLPIFLVLTRLGQEETASGMAKRVLRVVLVMWGTLALWVVGVFVLMVIGLTRAWR